MARNTPLAVAATIVVIGFGVPAGGPQKAGLIAPAAAAETGPPGPTGRHVLEGHASYYASHFAGRPMANGQRFDPRSDSAAHRTLPFGTPVQVTNLANGRSAVVVIRDRGPYSRRRIFDLSPRTADELGMRGSGVARVVARPLTGALVEVAEAP